MVTRKPKGLRLDAVPDPGTPAPDAIAIQAERARLRAQFHRDAREALDEMQATGLGHDWDDVKAYFARIAEHRAGCAPRPAALVPNSRPHHAVRVLRIRHQREAGYADDEV